MSRRSKHSKRWGVRVALCLLLGAATNLAVAYLIVYRVAAEKNTHAGNATVSARAHGYPRLRTVHPLFRRTGNEHENDRLHEWNRSGFGISFYSADRTVHRDDAFFDHVRYEASRVGWPLYTLRSDRVRVWNDFFGDSPSNWNMSPDHENSLLAGVWASELPEWVQEHGVDESQQFSHNIRSLSGTRPLQHVFFRGRRIPLMPMPLGFVANTLFYALPWALLVLGLPLVRGSIRPRRGLCPKCAYNRAGLTPTTPCPECGTPAPTPRPARRPAFQR